MSSNTILLQGLWVIYLRSNNDHWYMIKRKKWGKKNFFKGHQRALVLSVAELNKLYTIMDYYRA